MPQGRFYEPRASRLRCFPDYIGPRIGSSSAAGKPTRGGPGRRRAWNVYTDRDRAAGAGASRSRDPAAHVGRIDAGQRGSEEVDRFRYVLRETSAAEIRVAIDASASAIECRGHLHADAAAHGTAP